MKPHSPVLVSACLLGVNCRYDGTNNRDQNLIDVLDANGNQPVPVCPEQLGGLPTPRPKVWFTAGDGQGGIRGTASMIDETGSEPLDYFIRGAQEVLTIARQCRCETAILKQRSPSCGSRQVYRNGEITEGVGITCALLQAAGLEIFGEESFQSK